MSDQRSRYCVSPRSCLGPAGRVGSLGRRAGRQGGRAAAELTLGKHQRGVCPQGEFRLRPISSGQAPRVLSTEDGAPVLEALSGQPSGCSTSETGLAGVEEVGWQGRPRLPHLPLQTFSRVVAEPPCSQATRNHRPGPSFPPCLLQLPPCWSAWASAQLSVHRAQGEAPCPEEVTGGSSTLRPGNPSVTST